MGRRHRRHRGEPASRGRDEPTTDRAARCGRGSHRGEPGRARLPRRPRPFGTSRPWSLIVSFAPSMTSFARAAPRVGAASSRSVASARAPNAIIVSWGPCSRENSRTERPCASCRSASGARSPTRSVSVRSEEDGASAPPKYDSASCCSSFPRRTLDGRASRCPRTSSWRAPAPRRRWAVARSRSCRATRLPLPQGPLPPSSSRGCRRPECPC